MLFRKDGDVVRLDEGGPPLGILPDCRYAQQEVVLASGDRLLLFTDGVTESCNARGEEFGDDRLIALGRREGDAAMLHQSVVEARKAFSPAAPQDDVTVVTLWDRIARALKSSSRALGRSVRHVAPAANWQPRPPPGARQRPSRA